MLCNLLMKVSLLRSDRRGQELLEYALIAGFVASAAVCVFPAIASTSTLFNAVISVLSQAAGLSSGQMGQ